MPVITAAGDAAVVTAWFVDEGQVCQEGELIAEVQAEKVADEVRAPGYGFVVNRVAIGDPVPQGEVMCRVVDTIEADANQGKAMEDVAAGPRPDAAASPRPASPAAKRLAREKGVDLSTVSGTGPGGRITEADVLTVVSVGAAHAPRLREVIARNMRRSHSETAPVTLFTTVVMTERPQHVNAWVIKAVGRTLATHPGLNGRRDGDSFTPAAQSRLAIAIQTDEGLLAPILGDPETMTVEEIARAIDELADRARARALTAADYEGGTFTVTNLGGYGVEGFTPIINLPQVAILGIGALRDAAIVASSGDLVAGLHMTLSLTFDHAFVDGAPAAEFLRDLSAVLI